MTITLDLSSGQDSHQWPLLYCTSYSFFSGIYYMYRGESGHLWPLISFLTTCLERIR